MEDYDNGAMDRVEKMITENCAAMTAGFAHIENRLDQIVELFGRMTARQYDGIARIASLEGTVNRVLDVVELEDIPVVYRSDLMGQD